MKYYFHKAKALTGLVRYRHAAVIYNTVLRANHTDAEDEMAKEGLSIVGQLSYDVEQKLGFGDWRELQWKLVRSAEE